ncbi:MAG: hypothetical protein K0M40_03845 [Prolixibacteraceae bacterium]|nr:hypothetical protein [Prolixibacteraceae bacterium]
MDDFYLFERYLNEIDDDDLRAFYKKEVSDIKGQISKLKGQISDMQYIFDDLAEPIIKKAVRYVVRQIRSYSMENICWLSGGFISMNIYMSLNYFENICVMHQAEPKNEDPVIEDIIRTCCKRAYEKLSFDEKNILSFKTPCNAVHRADIIYNAFIEFASLYMNNKIRDALDA